LRDDVADVNLMGRIGRRRGKIAQPFCQLSAERRMRADLAQRLGTVAHQIRHVSKRIKNPFDSHAHRLC
jgi:hypothetical protein